MDRATNRISSSKSKPLKIPAVEGDIEKTIQFPSDYNPYVNFTELMKPNSSVSSNFDDR